MPSVAVKTETPDVETSSAEYRGRFSGPVGQFFLDVQSREVLRILREWPAARVLDVGGGHGQLAVPLVECGFDVTVVGSDESCRQRLDECLPAGSFQYRSCDLLNLPYDAKSFDVVLAFRLLTHLTRWQTAVREMCRVASKAVVVDYPDLCSFNFFSDYLFAAKKTWEGNTRPYRCFRRREIVEQFAQAGFGRPTARRQFFIPMVVHRMMKIYAASRIFEATARWTGLTFLFGSPVILAVRRQERDSHRCGAERQP